MGVSVLERRLGRNLDVAASTSTDEPMVITNDGYYKEEIQETRKYVEIQEVGHQTDSSRSTSPTISE